MRPWTLLLAAGCAGWGDPFTARARIAEARCARAFACQSEWPSEGGDFATVWGESVAGCQERLGPDPAQEGAWQDAEEAGLLAANPELGRACVEQVEAAPCADVWAEPPAACVDAVVGTGRAGESCRIDAACASGWCGERQVCEGA